jgi:homoserine O-succinyltransferase/O-acetyltransferase
MMETDSIRLAEAPTGRLAATPVTRQPPMRPLSIAVINNMPDSAMRVTERQICSVLAAASDGMVVDVKFYSLAELPRSAQARAHIDACYEQIDDLAGSRPDGLIVTGAEPLASCLTDDPVWRPLCNLIDWSEAEGIPAIWSCLAAHAAVLRLDGIERNRLPRKLSGLFTCSAPSRKHQIMHRMPRKWVVPHSRWNGLDPSAIEAQGYTILSSAGSAGVDMFMKQAPVLQIFLQGHLEYEAATLLAEYRRDVMRAAVAERPVLPGLPLNITDRGTADQIQCEAKAIIFGRRNDLMPRLDLLLRAAKPSPIWAPIAQTLFQNWLSYLDVCGVRCSELATPPVKSAFLPIGRLQSEGQPHFALSA